MRASDAVLTVLCSLDRVMLCAQVCKPKDFALQINLNMDNCWGIVRALVDLCLKLDDGKYLIVKDPNKQLLRLYSVPEDAFQENYTEELITEPEDAPEEEPAKTDAADED
jgi:translation initiation factor 3 subunit D